MRCHFRLTIAARFILTHDFVPNGDGQIAAKAGEVVTVLDRTEAGWANVIKDSGERVRID